MKYSVVCLIGLSLFAITLARSIYDIDGDIYSWRQYYVAGGNHLEVGFGWKEDGTVAAGARAVVSVNGKSIPITAALKSNIENMGHVTYEVGTNVFNNVDAVVTGDSTGEVKYLVNGNLALQDHAGTQLTLALEGNKLKPVKLIGQASQGSQGVVATVGISDSYKPSSLDVTAVKY